MDKHSQPNNQPQTNLNRVLVIGCSGSGKSTLTRKLSKLLCLPSIHLDVYFWQANWQETPRDIWRNKVKELVKQKSWVMDGTFSESIDIRFPLADLIVFLDLSRSTCLWRAIKRVFQYNRGRFRSDMAPGCFEKFDIEFYKYIWTFNFKIKPIIEEAFDKYDCHHKVIQLRSDQEVKDFIEILKTSFDPPHNNIL